MLVRKKALVVSLFLIMAFALVQSIPAQNVGAAKVYKTQFIELRAKVKLVFDRIEQQRGGLTDLREEILALTKLIHRLQEEAMGSDMESTKRGHESDKTLLLVSQGCIALDFVLTALSNHIDTSDRAFIGLAKDGDVLIKSIEKIL
jgi:hypothetical protein